MISGMLVITVTLKTQRLNLTKADNQVTRFCLHIFSSKIQSCIVLKQSGSPGYLCAWYYVIGTILYKCMKREGCIFRTDSSEQLKHRCIKGYSLQNACLHTDNICKVSCGMTCNSWLWHDAPFTCVMMCGMQQLHAAWNITWLTGGALSAVATDSMTRIQRWHAWLIAVAISHSVI